MQKIEYFTCVTTHFFKYSYFSVPKEFKLNSTNYLIMKIHNRKELQSIAINHSADLDHEDFVKICRKYTSKRFSFLTSDTILPANKFLRFRKNLWTPL